ncbi:MAG: VF530 family protein [Pseudomonadota bacterium]|nr:VF530 family protein [Pseudomonadota bacterium]
MPSGPSSASAASPAEAAAASPGQPGNPLHGVKLEAIVTALAAHYGWDGLGQRINIRCFTSEPSVASSLKFLRKTPWAREKVESLYLYMLREIRRTSPTAHNFPPPRA